MNNEDLKIKKMILNDTKYIYCNNLIRTIIAENNKIIYKTVNQYQLDDFIRNIAISIYEPNLVLKLKGNLGDYRVAYSNKNELIEKDGKFLPLKSKYLILNGTLQGYSYEEYDYKNNIINIQEDIIGPKGNKLINKGKTPIKRVNLKNYDYSTLIFNLDLNLNNELKIIEDELYVAWDNYFHSKLINPKYLFNKERLNEYSMNEEQMKVYFQLNDILPDWFGKDGNQEPPMKIIEPTPSDWKEYKLLQNIFLNKQKEYKTKIYNFLMNNKEYINITLQKLIQDIIKILKEGKENE